MALAKLLDADPRDRAAEVFLAASKRSVAAARIRVAEVLRGVSRTRLAPIALAAKVVHPVAENGAKVALEKISEAKNLVTDTEDWERETGSTPLKTRAPGILPLQLGRERLHAVLRHPDHLVAVYEETIVVMADGKEPMVFDAGAALHSGPQPLDIGFAQVVGNALVVQLAYNGYASASGGKTGYFAAFDSATGALAWTSAPLVSNSGESLVSGGSIVTGYGFTAEPDALFVLDLTTGAIDQKIPLKSGPERLRSKGDQLFVRTYDTNYVFRSKTGFSSAAPAILSAARGEPVRAASADERCWVRRATAAILAKDARALDEASTRLATASGDRVLDQVLRDQVQRLETPGTIDLPSAPLVVAPAPPWQERLGSAQASAAKAPRLVKKASVEASPVRGTERVYVATEPFYLAPAEDGSLPSGVRLDIPSSYGMRALRAIIPDERLREPGPVPKDARTILIYGGRYLALVSDAMGAERIFDVDAFTHPPQADPQWKQFATQEASYAQVRDNVLYICNGGGSYAKEVLGKKGFVSALDASTGVLIWRSAPLVCGATFSVAGDYLVTGYGFTAEPDFAFLIRRSDGAIVQKVALPSAPHTITRSGPHVHVETYDSQVDLELVP